MLGPLCARSTHQTRHLRWSTACQRHSRSPSWSPSSPPRVASCGGAQRCPPAPRPDRLRRRHDAGPRHRVGAGALVVMDADSAAPAPEPRSVPAARAMSAGGSPARYAARIASSRSESAALTAARARSRSCRSRAIAASSGSSSATSRAKSMIVRRPSGSITRTTAVLTAPRGGSRPGPRRRRGQRRPWSGARPPGPARPSSASAYRQHEPEPAPTSVGRRPYRRAVEVPPRRSRRRGPQARAYLDADRRAPLGPPSRARTGRTDERRRQVDPVQLDLHQVPFCRAAVTPDGHRRHPPMVSQGMFGSRKGCCIWQDAHGTHLSSLAPTWFGDALPRSSTLRHSGDYIE